MIGYIMASGCSTFIYLFTLMSISHPPHFIALNLQAARNWLGKAPSFHYTVQTTSHRPGTPIIVAVVSHVPVQNGRFQLTMFTI